MTKPAKTIPSKITIRELKSAEILSIWPLIKMHNPHMGKAEFTKKLAAMRPLSYRAVAAYQGKTMVGVSGFWIGMRFWCGKLLDIDNFVVHEAYRNAGVGMKLMAWFEEIALAEKCELMVLDVYAQSFLAHRFYHRNGFSLTGYHMAKVPGSNIPFVPGRHRE